MKLNYVLIGAALGLLSLIGTVSSCKKKTSDDPTADYDRTPLLTNVGNNIIIPNYKNLSTAVNSLDSAITAFNANPTVANLSSLQDYFKEAYRAWQSCTTFELGPAADVYLRASLDTYPTTVAQINSNIASGTYNFEALVNSSARGFPAIDYMLFGVAADNASIVAEYSTASDAASRRKYLTDLSSYMKGKVTSTLNSWLPTGGNYLQQFISNNGIDAASSTALLVNQFVQDYDNMKYYKVNIPLGTPPSIASHPEKVEAYYCGISSELIQLELAASQALYLGNSSKGNGIGFDDYLISINGIRQSDGAPLDPLIKTQFTSAISKMALVPDPLSTTIGSTPAVVNTAYIELQKQLPLIKQEMPANMDILISYGDTDGD